MRPVRLSFQQLLSRGHPLILDGGLATQLESQGQDLDTDLWSARMLLDNPQAIIDAHRSYLDAGAQCVITASYQATKQGFMPLGLSATEARNLITKSVSLAMTARDEFLEENKETEVVPLVAASVGPYGASLADGSEYTGNYGVDDQTLCEFHKERLGLLDDSEADLLACETIPSLQEARVLHDLLLEVRTPAWVSFSCKDGLHLNDGAPMAQCAALFSDHPKVLALGVNCTSPQYIASLVKEIKTAVPDKAIVVYPNSGEQYETTTNTWHGTVSPIDCGAAAEVWRREGADVIGGCCRMGPAHIKEMRKRLSE